jgi:hypothetical protein
MVDEARPSSAISQSEALASWTPRIIERNLWVRGKRTPRGYQGEQSSSCDFSTSARQVQNMPARERCQPRPPAGTSDTQPWGAVPGEGGGVAHCSFDLHQCVQSISKAKYLKGKMLMNDRRITYLTGMTLGSLFIAGLVLNAMAF